MTRGSIKIQNVSGTHYVVEELGGLVVADQETIDLLDPALVQHYADWEDANRLVTSLPTAKLYQDIQAGVVVVIENTRQIELLPGLPS
jgi:hypothetical protein